MRIYLGVLTLIVGLVGTTAFADSRLERIQRRGFLTCGVEPAVPGFAEVDVQGRYRGFAVDVCRALAAAIGR